MGVVPLGSEMEMSVGFTSAHSPKNWLLDTGISGAPLEIFGYDTSSLAKTFLILWFFWEPGAGLVSRNGSVCGFMQ